MKRRRLLWKIVSNIHASLNTTRFQKKSQSNAFEVHKMDQIPPETAEFNTVDRARWRTL